MTANLTRTIRLWPKEPSKSLLPASSLMSSCHEGDAGTGCNSLALRAIGHARQVLEKMGGMTCSMAAYGKLTPAERLFVTVNLERTQRGLAPAVVLTRSLDKVAQAGPGGTNLDCTTARSAQCWGHRNIILGTFASHSVCGGSASELAMGAGHTTGMAHYGESDTECSPGSAERPRPTRC
jgi:hypothetical protein